MQVSNPALPAGYSPLPPGMIANVVTCLEMTAKPPARTDRPRPGLELARWDKPDLDAYRALYRRVGQDWLWFSRLFMADDKLTAVLTHPQVAAYVLRDGRVDIGLLELDFREAGQCELAFFGLVPEAIGKGAGRFLMDRAIDLAWAQPIERFWVHTCTFDHPAAAAFYQRSGFRPYAMLVEVHRDPRVTGHLPKTAAPQVPIIEG
jgi:GNAT superfamily N-acetyltransferase